MSRRSHHEPSDEIPRGPVKPEPASYSKAAAARLLRVSAKTVNHWMTNGLLPLAEEPGDTRRRIPAVPLLELVAEVTELREIAAAKPELLAAAVRRLAQEEELEELRQDERFLASLEQPQRGQRFADGDLVSAALPDDWHPGD